MLIITVLFKGAATTKSPCTFSVFISEMTDQHVNLVGNSYLDHPLSSIIKKYEMHVIDMQPDVVSLHFLIRSEFENMAPDSCYNVNYLRFNTNKVFARNYHR